MQMKALIVDDDPVNRKLLKAILKKEGYIPLEVENGEAAIVAFNRERPDIILMDIMMPIMNGYDAARKIKEASVDRFVPIIFLTAVTDEEALSRCVESGGDDFLTKPYHRVILKAKISAMERIRSLYTTLNRQKHELEIYRANIQHELEFAEHIFQNITTKGALDLQYLRFWTSSMSMSMFNGDLMLTARKPAGGIHLLLCDFTGHGLPAAVGALPVSDVFVAMTERGFSMPDIITEMNRKLKRELPTGFFCAAAFVDVDVTQGTIAVWNAGLPPIVLLDRKRNIFRSVKSGDLPLGIIDKPVNREAIQVVEITSELRLFMYTDGLIETANESGELFGQERLNDCFKSAPHESTILDYIQQTVEGFRGQSQQADDISAVQLNCFEAQRDVPDEAKSLVGPQKVIAAEWSVRFDLTAQVLKDINPVPMILNLMRHLRLPDDHRKRIFTVLTELYTNALDHGLLGLSSTLKSTPEGFAMYYRERERRMAQLRDGHATIRIQQTVEGAGYALRVSLTDSGPGFDVEHVLQKKKNVEPVETTVPSGRGITLVKSLCQGLIYRDGGRTAEAVYYLGDRTK